MLQNTHEVFQYYRTSIHSRITHTGVTVSETKAEVTVKLLNYFFFGGGGGAGAGGVIPECLGTALRC